MLLLHVGTRPRFSITGLIWVISDHLFIKIALFPASLNHIIIDILCFPRVIMWRNNVIRVVV
jgi:hypothetical protein